MNVKSVKGIAVVTISGGEKLGTVEDVIIDAQSRAIGAVKLQSGGLLHKDHCYVPFDEIGSLGQDAIMVRDGEVLQASFGEHPSGYYTLSNIGDVKVVTEAGNYIGKLDDLRFDEATGAVTDFEVSKPGIGNVFSGNTNISAAGVTSLGRDIMVVADSFSEGHAS